MNGKYLTPEQEERFHKLVAKNKEIERQNEEKLKIEDIDKTGICSFNGGFRYSKEWWENFRKSDRFSIWSKNRREMYLGENNPNKKEWAKIICNGCGNTFQTIPCYKKKRKYCSYECFIKSLDAKVIKSCLNCKKEFESYKSLEKKFCSLKCYCGKKHKDSLIILQCKICKNNFEVRNKDRKRIYCSMKCLAKDKEQLGLGKNNPNFGKTHSNMHSEETKERWRKERKGVGNPRWLGGISYYRGEDWQEKQKECLKRDNYKCRKCGRIDKLKVHHIIPYRISKRNILYELITLCQKCHPTMDNKYRTIGITRYILKLFEINKALERRMKIKKEDMILR